jgi:hypothetical protein
VDSRRKKEDWRVLTLGSITKEAEEVIQSVRPWMDFLVHFVRGKIPKIYGQFLQKVKEIFAEFSQLPVNSTDF